MGKSEGSLQQVELKYCERCGGLWLRAKGSERVYCGTCSPAMAELPEPRPRRDHESRLPLAPDEFDLDGTGVELWAVVEVRP